MYHTYTYTEIRAQRYNIQYRLSDHAFFAAVLSQHKFRKVKWCATSSSSSSSYS